MNDFLMRPTTFGVPNKYKLSKQTNIISSKCKQSEGIEANALRCVNRVCYEQEW